MSKLSLHIIPSYHCPERMSEVICAPSQYEALRDALAQAGFEVWLSHRYATDGFPTGQIYRYLGHEAGAIVEENEK